MLMYLVYLLTICKVVFIMARVLKNKDLINTRLAANYGGWMYCTECNENIGYLCYATYDKIKLDYECKCGSIGSALLDFEDSTNGIDSKDDLVIIKNRFCCPKDLSPLITILSKKVKRYSFEITCKACGKTYIKTEE